MTCAFPPVPRPNAALMQQCTCEHQSKRVSMLSAYGPECVFFVCARACRMASLFLLWSRSICIDRFSVSCLQVCLEALILCAFVIEVVAVREVNVRSSKF